MSSTTMNFILEGRDRLSDVLNRAGDSAIMLNSRLKDTEDHGAKAIEGLKKTALSLAPALVPAAAAMAPLVASTAAAGVAVAAYGAALGPQIAAMSEASQAEKKYTDAVEKSGAGSKQAVAAQTAYQQAMAKLPPATRTAAAALSVLKDQYKSWSDGLAADTMGPVVKGMAVFGALLPKLTPLVKGTSTELNRMMTLVAGGVASPGFDKLMGKFSAFSTGVLQRANDSIVHLLRTLDTGKVGSGLSEFMDYARAQGPLLGSVLKNIGTALMNVMRASADVGVGMLQAVNALAKLVAAVPPGVITVLMQLAVAMKVARLAAIGLAASRAAFAAFGAQLLAMRTAAGGASGGLASFTAAIGAMSRGAKIAMAGTAIGLLIMAITELSQIGKKAPPDVDKLTTALGKLGQTGKVTGEAASQFGTHLEKLKSLIDKVTDPSVAESVNNWGAKVSGGILDAGEATEELTKSFGSIDESLANMVRSGKADLAKAALESMLSSMKPDQVEKLKGSLDKYDAALADAAFEQDLATQAMGLFGAQAQSVQTKLNAQKASADGLTQSINALTTATLTARGDMRSFEEAIDAADAAAKKNGKTLDINTEKGRANSAALDGIATSTIKGAESARANGAAWSTVNGIYDRGYNAMVKAAMAMGLDETAARKLANQILKTPDKTARLKGNMEDLQAKLNNAKAQLKKVPDSRKAAIRAEISDLQFKIAQAKYALSNLDKDYTITLHYRTTGSPYRPSGGREMATGGLVGFPSGGPVRGPGTGTSDSILTRLSNGEYVIPAERVDQYGLGLFDAIRSGQLGMSKPTPRPMAPTRPADPGRAAGRGGTTTVIHNEIHIHDAIDTTAVGQKLETIFAKYQRDKGGAPLNFKTK